MVLLFIKEIRILQVQIVVIVSFGHISLRLPIVIIYYLLIVTNPLITTKTYQEFLKIFNSKKNIFDSFNTVTEVKEFLFLEKKPINFQLDKAPNSQDLPDMIKLNFAINILPTKLMKKKKSLIETNHIFSN